SAPEAASDTHISVPREVWTYVDEPSEEPEPVPRESDLQVKRASAYIPFAYIPEAHQRIEVYRKLAQATDKASLDQLRAEMRDRFGKIPTAVEVLLDLAELKYVAAERHVTAIETRGDRLMLT